MSEGFWVFAMRPASATKKELYFAQFVWAVLLHAAKLAYSVSFRSSRTNSVAGPKSSRPDSSDFRGTRGPETRECMSIGGNSALRQRPNTCKKRTRDVNHGVHAALVLAPRELEARAAMSAISSHSR